MKCYAKILFVWLLVWLPPFCAAQERVWEIRDFGGGMITDYDAEDLPPNAGVWASDCDVHRGQLGTRQGYVEWRDIDKWCWDFINYEVSMPKGAAAGQLLERKITLYHARTIQDSTLELESCYMYPTYTRSGNDTTPNLFGDGTWADSLSADLNNPSAVYVPGRDYRLRSSGWGDYVIGRNDIRIAAGSSYGISGHDAVVDSNANYTYSWFFGYIGRYRYTLYNRVDGHYLYQNVLFPPKYGILSSITKVHKISAPVNYPGTGLDAGRYYFKIIYIYDGYQYSSPMKNYLYNTVVGADSIFAINFSVDTTVTATEEPNMRVTALEIYAAGPYTTYNFSSEVIESLPYKLVRHIGIADNIYTNLGYLWKDDPTRRWWARSSNTYIITAYVDKDDIDGNGMLLSTRQDYSGNEIAAASRYIAEINGQTWNGNVYIGGPNSKVNQGWSNMVIISPVFQPDVLAINNFITVGSGQGQSITGMKAWNGQMLIWTKDALEIWSAGTIPTMVRRYDGYGMSAPNSIQVTQNGVFYAAPQAIYMYNGSIYDLTGAVGPQGSVRSIEAVYDSISTASISGVKILNYCESAYVKDQEKYVLIYDTSTVANADTLAGNTVWGGIYPPYKTGGRKLLTYDLKTGAWTRGQFGGKFSSIFGNYDNTINAFNRSDSAFYRLFYTNLDFEDDISSVWKSGWLDFGAPGVEKNLVGVGLDYELSAWTASSPWHPDTVRVTIYVDGRISSYGKFDFYASDSTLATLDDNYRRVQFVKGDSSGVDISDPGWGKPVMFQAVVNWGGALSYTDNPGKINAIRFYWLEERRRQ